MIIIILFLFVIALYLLMIMPNIHRKYAFQAYEKTFIAHRGLFNNIDIPENSLASFSKAVENNYGIELDVQLTSDDKLVVFHDESLLRMCGINKLLRDCTYQELQEYKLLNTNYSIPLFADVIKLLRKDTPLIIEVKPEGRCIETCKKTVAMMKDYEGIYNMESFNPKVVRYLRVHEPQIIRGQLSYNYLKDKDSNLNVVSKFVLSNLFLNFYTKPDYIAYDCKSIDNLSFKIISKIYKAECVAWTIKSQIQLEHIKKYYKCFIFDSFIPKENAE